MIAGQSVEARHVRRSKSFHLSLKYNTSLFRVSKDISRETLEYFHSQNVFVVVKLSNWYKDPRHNGRLGFLYDLCHYSIPMATRGCGKEYALKIELVHEDPEGLDDGKKKSHAKPSVAVFSGMHSSPHSIPCRQMISSNCSPFIVADWPILLAGKHLPMFMQFLNVVQIPDRNRAFSYTMKKIRFLPATKSKYYQGNTKAASCVQNAIAACRQGVLMQSDGSKTDIKITSGAKTGITASQAANFKRAMLPLPTQEECLTLASAARDKGDAFFEAKNYLGARQEYALAVCLLGHDLWSDHSMTNFEKPSITEEREPRTLLLRTFMEAFRLCLTLEQPDVAEDLVDYAERGCEPDIVGEDFALDVLVTKARLLADRGQFSTARSILKKELAARFPNSENRRIEAALQEVVAKQMQKYREDVARMKAGRL